MFVPVVQAPKLQFWCEVQAPHTMHEKGTSGLLAGKCARGHAATGEPGGSRRATIEDGYP